MTGRELDNQFQWAAHEPAALAEDLSQEIIDVVKYRQPATGLGPEESVIVAFGGEVYRDKKVSSGTFARAVELFGHEGVMNRGALMGNYAATAITLNAVDQHIHPDRQPLLPLP